MTYTVSNRKTEQACNRGRANMEIPWPSDILGPYGANASTDADLDRYVFTHVAANENVQIAGACAGRTQTGMPVIVVSLRPRLGESAIII